MAKIWVTWPLRLFKLFVLYLRINLIGSRMMNLSFYDIQCRNAATGICSVIALWLNMFSPLLASTTQSTRSKEGWFDWRYVALALRILPSLTVRFQMKFRNKSKPVITSTRFKSDKMRLLQNLSCLNVQMYIHAYVRTDLMYWSMWKSYFYNLFNGVGTLMYS